MIRRIGFACKLVEYNETTGIISPVDGCNMKSTTVAWLNRQKRNEAEKKLWDIMIYNTASVENMLNYISKWPDNLRQVRLGSEMLPVYTEATWSYFWQLPHVKTAMAAKLKTLGDLARKHDIRVSQHPGQFVCMSSDRPDVVERSIAEFEYHADVARMMGYGGSWHDHGYKINIHISGRHGPDGMIASIRRLSTEARNLLTIENDEMSWGLDDTLLLAEHTALVLDVHHHFVKTGAYISPTDDRVKRVLDSWRGVRPTLHYSLPISGTSHVTARGTRNTTKLRAHSDMCWHAGVNDYVMKFWDSFDIMCEMKNKNIAQWQLYEQALNTGHIKRPINENQSA
ncbi:Uve UV damage repair endonuclease [uncultured Caudovirales phage]|uniref:Uve UV damage repair endonuclease n=1 Tax=uncultured Caudovirales phage TaxID=2100421 RepID=A0A6J5KKC8_9CAUD|nr:Uve UV damage repair endonuclease [uncultured Caudovirales phage]